MGILGKPSDKTMKFVTCSITILLGINLSLSCAASLFKEAESYSEKATHIISPATPRINNRSDQSLTVSAFRSTSILNPKIPFGTKHWARKTESFLDSPQIPSKTKPVNTISNQPHQGIQATTDEIKSKRILGVKVVSVCLLVQALALIIFAFFGLDKRN
jgi:hypothetical protein